MAPPAPASETAMPSAFCMQVVATSPVVPLAERDCNNGACKLSHALRRSASFLDAEDACLALPDKASFLIPEDSYLPGQENCTARRAPAASASGRPASPCQVARTETAADARPLAPSSAPCARHLLGSAFLSPDLGALAVDEEFVAASVCFERAVQELEMAELPVDPPSARSASGLAGAQASQHCCPPRYVSSLAPSPATSTGQLPQGSEGELPAQPQGNSAGGCDSASGTELDADAVTSVLCATGLQGCSPAGLVVETAVCGPAGVQLPLEWWQQEQQNQQPVAVMFSFDMAAAGAAGVAGHRDCEPDSVPVSPAAPVVAAVPVPIVQMAVPRAFHHKTGGPCDHCGATESPQWRRGPPAKPMLCNACGTRYRRTNQLNPASANAAAARAAAAAAAAAGCPMPQPPSKARGTKRDPTAGGGASKRGRVAYC